MLHRLYNVVYVLHSNITYVPIDMKNRGPHEIIHMSPILWSIGYGPYHMINMVHINGQEIISHLL